MKKIVVIVLFLSMSVIFLVPAGAQVPTRAVNRVPEREQEPIELQNKGSEQRLLMKQEREEKIQLMQCEAAKNRANAFKGNYEAQQLRYGNRYVNLLARLNNLVDMLEDKDYDTMMLPEYLDALTDMIDDFNADLKELISKFNEMTPVTCTTKGQEHVVKLRELKQESSELRAKSKEIHQYFLNTILPELKKVRAQFDDENEVEPVEETSENSNLTN